MSKQTNFWEFKNLTTNSAELMLYGPISSTSWWGDEVTPQQFADDLKALGNVSSIDVHINSPGGDVFAGVAIYNMLKSHLATINVHIDGLAASIASVIAMAGDTIKMPLGSMMMIHNPACGLFGAYQASELAPIIEKLGKIKESMVTLYAEKCGKETSEIADIMDAETWYTAQDAVEHKFATECDSSISYAASLDKSCLNINGVSVDISAFRNLPNIISKAVMVQKPKENKSEEDSLMNLDELKAKYPDLYKQVKAEGVTEERERQKAIDSVSMAGHEALVIKAKYENGISAEQVAMQIIAAEKALRTGVLTDLTTDVAESNVNKVPADVPPDAKTEAEEKERAAAVNAVAAAANQGRK